jgi:hypothetical protein
METKELKYKAIMMLKADIKEKVELQKFYKNQRRTVRLVGERKISPDAATWKHYCNREDLRNMYLAYGILRDKDLSTIDREHKELRHTAMRVAEGYEIKALAAETEKVE